MKRNSKHRSFGALALTLVLAAGSLLAITGCNQGRQMSASQTEAVTKLGQSDGSITVVPVILADNPSVDVAEVLALFLERGGMTRIEIETEAFTPPADADLDGVATAFASYVRERNIDTQCAMFSEYEGTPQTGVAAVNTIIVDANGEPIFVDAQTASDKDFKRLKPGCPMTCSQLVIERVRPVLQIEDPMRDGAPEDGPIAQRWAAKSGIPSEAELNAIKDRQTGLKKALATGTTTILAVSVNEKADAECAAHLAELLGDAGFMGDVKVAPQPVVFRAERSSNQMKRLWEVGRAFREEVRSNPRATANADYVLYAEYLVSTGGSGGVGGVHVYLCERSTGDWIVVDLQNDHHADYQRIDPRNASDCDRLVVARLKSYL